MQKYFPLVLLAAATLIPACCTHQRPIQNFSELSDADLVIDKTAALVHYIGFTGTDDDGDRTFGEVDPEKDPQAELKPYCAATWVSSDVMLTAYHCVSDIGKPPVVEGEGPTTLEKMLEHIIGGPSQEWNPIGQELMYSVQTDIHDDANGAKFRGTNIAFVLATDPKHDLALVKARPLVGTVVPRHGVAKLAEARVGQDVQIVGHTVGLWWTYMRGSISQVRPNMPNANEDPTDVLQVAAPVFHGNSGGGAFNADGELLGVCSWIQSGLFGMGFFINAHEALPMLQHQSVVVVPR
jgi:hypothetical protein